MKKILFLLFLCMTCCCVQKQIEPASYVITCSANKNAVINDYLKVKYFDTITSNSHYMKTVDAEFLTLREVSQYAFLDKIEKIYNDTSILNLLQKQKKYVVVVYLSLQEIGKKEPVDSMYLNIEIPR